MSNRYVVSNNSRSAVIAGSLRIGPGESKVYEVVPAGFDVALSNGILSSRALEPVRVTSATIAADGVTLSVVFSSPVSAATIPAAGFSWSKGAITSAVKNGTFMDLTVPLVYQGYAAGNIYYDGITGTLCTATGAIDSSGAFPITNNSTQNDPPLLISATVLASGTELDLVMSENITGTANLGFTRSVSSITSGTIVTGTIQLAIPKTYIGQNPGTIAYNAAVGDIAGVSFDLASFAAVDIVNSSAQGAPALVSATILADGVSLELVFDDTITGSPLLGLTASVVNITAGAIVTTTLTLTIDVVLTAAAVGTISYNSVPGTLAGGGGDVATFGPIAIVNNSTQV